MTKYMDDILGNLSDGILIVDRNYTIIYANEKVVEFCGSPTGGIIGQKCHAVFHSSSTPCEPGALCSHLEVFSKEQPVTLKHHHLLPNGSTRIFEISASPLRDKNGTVDRLIQILRDITLEEKLRQELAVNHQNLELIFSNAPFVISFLDKEMRVIRLNAAMEALAGIRSEEAQGKHCYDCWGQYSRDPDRRGRERICDGCHVSIVLRDGAKHSHERRLGDRIIEVISNPVRDADGTIIGVMEIGQDITDRHRAGVALQESENNYKALFDNSPNVLCVADFSGMRACLAAIAAGGTMDYEAFFRENPEELATCMSQLRLFNVNQAALSLFGAASQEELFAGLFTIIGPETVAQTAGGMSALGKGETSFEHEIVLNHLLTGAKIYCILRWNVVPGYEGSYQRVILSLTDISARKKAENKLADRSAQLRMLSARLFETKEAERRRLAKDLHDKLGQQLTALTLNLNIIEQSLPPKQIMAQQKRITDTLRLLEEITEQVRDITADLRPPVLDDYGLTAALRWHGAIFSQRSGILCMLKGAEIPRLPPPTEMTLFRVVQEALNNVAKHSRANRVEIRSILSGNRLSLVVQDNGRGFPKPDETVTDHGVYLKRSNNHGISGHRVPQVAASGTAMRTFVREPDRSPQDVVPCDRLHETDLPDALKLGLVSMGERVASVGGTLVVTSASDSGTIITVEIGL